MTVKRTPKTFLIEKINDLVERFDKISCQYEVKDNSGLHFIKIIPRMYFKNHSLLQEAMMDLLDDFNEFFPEDGLGFFTAESTINIENPLYEAVGKEYLDWRNLDSNCYKKLDKSFTVANPHQTDFSGYNYLAA